MSIDNFENEQQSTGTINTFEGRQGKIRAAVAGIGIAVVGAGYAGVSERLGIDSSGTVDGLLQVAGGFITGAAVIPPVAAVIPPVLEPLVNRIGAGTPEGPTDQV